MIHRTVLTFLFLSAQAVAAKLLSRKCPPEGFDALNPFDLDSYISERWYPQQAAPVIYAQGQSYCSVVQYKMDDSCRFFCGDKPRINVINKGQSGGVGGESNEARINAFVPNPDEPAKIRVSPPQRFTRRTNYWVVAAGTYADAINSTEPLQPQPVSNQYEWAVIAGAKPFRETDNGKCMPGFGSFDTRGLWMFARDPFPPDGVIEAVTMLVDSMGLDTTQWIPVIHEGCVYPDPE
jgi:lipocalin